MSGLKIKRFREEKHYSQEELASLLGVTRRTISRWEQNSSKPNADELSKIAKYIGVTEEELLSDDDMYNSLATDCTEIIKILTAIIKTLKGD